MASRIAVVLFSVAVGLGSGCGSDDPKPDAAPAGDGATCSGTTPYLAACTNDEQCTSCMCRSFGHTKACTKACNGPEDCPAPSGGCTNNICRP